MLSTRQEASVELFHSHSWRPYLISRTASITFSLNQSRSQFFSKSGRTYQKGDVVYPLLRTVKSPPRQAHQRKSHREEHHTKRAPSIFFFLPPSLQRNRELFSFPPLPHPRSPRLGSVICFPPAGSFTSPFIQSLCSI